MAIFYYRNLNTFINYKIFILSVKLLYKLYKEEWCFIFILSVYIQKISCRQTFSRPEDHYQIYYSNFLEWLEVRFFLKNPCLILVLIKKKNRHNLRFKKSPRCNFRIKIRSIPMGASEHSYLLSYSCNLWRKHGHDQIRVSNPRSLCWETKPFDHHSSL